ncbi:MAG: GNAT family N-acetyltransferase [Capsulimonas sp.]|uniref:GNAT family N-acetyltransferase n=1 Tax=Capsulimonas sp. TaxID=2494211 RepID=UPI0032666467
MIDLFPMTEADFLIVAETVGQIYAESLTKSGRISAEDAEEEARQTREGLILGGLNAPNCYFLTIHEAADKPSLGHVILRVIPKPHRTVGEIWYIGVHEEHRGKGIGAEALAALEVKARDLGVQQLDLQVFTDNDAAVALYDKVGYRPTSFFLSKALTESTKDKE